MSVINFKTSYIGWEGESSGKFKLISVLKIKYKKKISEIFGLGESVLACNVYSNKNIIKSPNYLFQLIGSQKRQKILRTYIKENFKKSKDLINDSNLEKIFENFILKINKKKSKKIYKLQKKNHFKSNKIINTKINFNSNKDFSFEIEFPVNHINFYEKNNDFHIETGPILMPVFNSKNTIIDLSPCFVAFNRFDYYEFFRDYPIGYRKINFRNLKDFSYHISLYEY